MTINTGGPIRGVIGRWLMRFEAASGILRIVFLGITAISTLSTYLAVAGLDRFTPYVVVLGFIGTVAFAWGYAEMGVLNRKNRERADYGDNYSGPTMYFDRQIDAVQRAYLAHALRNGETDLETMMEDMQELTKEEWLKYRDGMDPREIEA